MDTLANIAGWISQNEALLSGTAAMIVLAGVIFTPLGAALRRVVSRRSGGDTNDAALAPPEAVNQSTIQASPPEPAQLGENGSLETRRAITVPCR